ncbi:mannose-6-phosphate isomerase, class I [Cellulomonas carbonis]|uniref:mannose-6-phosphate isomerase n=1 Tax=Cellulomonas carbonis T26 TaxID=947969 RepID=A0A0A0BMI4_9CELL|nr:mannose-6-phosphate isomerase, class I [Cellulomonas carbonis]KGM09166.1 mannose-6-phosphate isomerase [Cellulomonas carbonis T26]GGC11428.1 mannose-6-phosphate isomerase [Cellulomonas carbonis]
MHRLENPVREYDWGSPTTIPELLGRRPTTKPAAELWLGAHPSAPSTALTPDGPVPLDEYIGDDPAGVLGADVVARFGACLPYLLKIIAADKPLSLQVHPSADAARAGFEREELSGVAIDDPHRNYKDRNHKPELVFALTPFQAMCGFRAPRRAAELVAGLDAELAHVLHADLRADPSFRGIRAAFRRLLDPHDPPTAAQVGEVVDACRERLAAGSPSPRADGTVVLLAEHYPGDPGVVTSLLLNPVTLQPGEALFVPAGGVHAYLSGTAVEIMANSDNVLRAGLTSKHIDIPELLDNVDYVAAPPIRVAPEAFHGSTKAFYAPVDDFELSFTRLTDGAVHPLPGRGPRVLLCLEGAVTLESATGDKLDLVRGESAFVPARDGSLVASGVGTVVQADVP